MDRPKAEIVADLHKRGFHQIGGGDEDASTASTTATGYEYLLGAPLWNLTKERIHALKKKEQTKIQERDTLQQTAPESIWSDELETARVALEKLL